MTDAEVKRKAREARDRAKEKKKEIMREIRRLERAVEEEDAVIMSCLAILDEIAEKEAES